MVIAWLGQYKRSYSETSPIGEGGGGLRISGRGRCPDNRSPDNRGLTVHKAHTCSKQRVCSISQLSYPLPTLTGVVPRDQIRMSLSVPTPPPTTSVSTSSCSMQVGGVTCHAHIILLVGGARIDHTPLMIGSVGTRVVCVCQC